MLPADIQDLARRLVEEAHAAGLRLVTAESCTGGLVAAAIVSVPGSSAVLERGLVSYSNQAKAELLGVDPALMAEHGAVSEPVACAMAAGALLASPAELSVAVTGVAGPGGGSAAKPVGTVHLATARRGGPVQHRLEQFGDLGRHEVQAASVRLALALLRGRVVGG